jgi:hypothetical protein
MHRTDLVLENYTIFILIVRANEEKSYPSIRPSIPSVFRRHYPRCCTVSGPTFSLLLSHPIIPPQI